MVERANQVWSTEITRLPDAVGIHVSGGYSGLYSRYVLGFALSNTLDTVFCLQVKYEDIYLRDYGSVEELDGRLGNQERPHQSLGYPMPAVVHGVVKP